MKCPTNQEDVLQEFIKNAKWVWNSPKLIDQIKIEIMIKDHDKMMKQHEAPLAILHSGNARAAAFGDHLIKTPSETILVVSSDICTWPEEKIRDGLRHEALHLGYQGHSKEFIKVAQEKGIPITRHMLEGGRFALQRKEGARFKTVMEFDTEKEAKAYYAEHFKGSGDRFRIQF